MRARTEKDNRRCVRKGKLHLYRLDHTALYTVQWGRWLVVLPPAAASSASARPGYAAAHVELRVHLRELALQLGDAARHGGVGVAHGAQLLLPLC